MFFSGRFPNVQSSASCDWPVKSPFRGYGVACSDFNISLRSFTMTNLMEVIASGSYLSFIHLPATPRP